MAGIEHWRRKHKAEGDTQITIFGTDRNKKIDKVAYVQNGDAALAQYIAVSMTEMIGDYALCPEDVSESVVVVADGLTIKKLEFETYYDTLEATHDKVTEVDFVCGGDRYGTN